MSRKKGKRVATQGKFVIRTAEVLQLVKEAEEAIKAKKRRKRPRKRSISVEIEEDEENELENISSDLESDCIVVAEKRLK
jgi:hypothetical protein